MTLENLFYSKILLFFIPHFSRIDLFIGALDENLVTNKYLFASRPYHHDYLTWCVQKTTPIPLWQHIFHLCSDWIVYAAITVTAIILIAFEYYLIHFERPFRNWNEMLTITLCAALGLPVAFTPRTNAFRVLFVFGLFAGLMFAITVSSMVMRLITSPILRPQIQTIAEITTGHFKMVGDRFVFHWMSKQNQVNVSQPHFNHFDSFFMRI